MGRAGFLVEALYLFSPISPCPQLQLSLSLSINYDSIHSSSFPCANLSVGILPSNESLCSFNYSLLLMDDNHRSPSKDYYKVLEVDYDATDEKIKLNYRKLALKWHPDKHNGDCAVTEKFQEINEAYTVLSDPDKRLEYDLNGNYEIEKYTLREYLSRFKGMILTCNGLGISHTSIWSQPLMELDDFKEN